MRYILVFIVFSQYSFAQNVDLFFGVDESYFISPKSDRSRLNSELVFGVEFFDSWSAILSVGYSVDKRMLELIPNDFSNISISTKYRFLKERKLSPIIKVGIGKGLTYSGKGELVDGQGNRVDGDFFLGNRR